MISKKATVLMASKWQRIGISGTLFVIIFATAILLQGKQVEANVDYLSSPIPYSGVDVIGWIDNPRDHFNVYTEPSHVLYAQNATDPTSFVTGSDSLYSFYLCEGDYVTNCVMDASFEILNGELVNVSYSGGTDLFSSRIISVVPENASTTGYTTEIGASGYVSSSDYESGMVLHVYLTNNTLQNGIGGSALDAWNSVYGGIEFPITSSGFFDVSTTTTFDLVGDVNVIWQIQVPNDTWLIGSLLSPQTLVSTSTYFTVVQRTGLDIAMASSSDALISALITGTTTLPVLECGGFGANFDLQKCLISIVVPSSAVLKADLDMLKEDVLTRFPLGYITRFVAIIATTSSSSMPVISATIPSGIIGAGASIQLDPNHALDYILNATTSGFTNASASSSDTFLDITLYYWNLLVYLALAFYMIRRILGTHIIPLPFIK